MENPAGAASDLSSRRSKRVRVSGATDAGGNRQSGMAGENPDSNLNAEDLDQGPDDGSLDDFEAAAPKSKKSRTAAVPKEIELSLIEVIKCNGRLIGDAVKKWVEKYEKSPNSALVELLMTLFEVCGAKYKFKVDKIDETDVDDVVIALVNRAKNGEVEDLFNSKRKELKNLKENLALFWDNLVVECQHGPLFDQILFEKCMDYVIALSCTPPRVYRHVSSLVGLQLVTSFITVAKALGGQRETTQRQLNAEIKKRNDGPRMESLNKRLSATHEKITMIEEMMRKVFTGLFVHRYRDIDPDIRASCIRFLGVWIVSYPSLFLQDLYLKYLGWTLNDKSASVRKASIMALQNLYEVDDNVPSLGLFTERFCNRMVELADDIDVSVAVSAIGLLKQLLRHQLLADDLLGPLYDLLIDEPPAIRRAIGELVYDHLIAQKFSTSQTGSSGEDSGSSEVHLGRMLQILREFATDPILITYVIDDVWDDMKAMKDWKCIMSMLLDENPMIELTDIDATNLVRLLCASAKKAVGEKIVPVIDNRKQYYTKAQKESLEHSRREITSAIMKNYPQLLRKFLADKEKVSSLVEMIMHLKLDLYSLKRQEQNFKTVVQLVKDAFFKHGEKHTLRSCIKALIFCSTESQGELQDFVQSKLKDLENVLKVKLKYAFKEAEMQVGDDYSLLVNLKRLYELQLAVRVSIENLFEDLVSILNNIKNVDDEVVCFLLLNMYLLVAWSLHSIDGENPSEASVSSLLTKRTTLFKQLENFSDTLLEGDNGESRYLLTSRVCTILVETWCLFKKSRFSSTKLESLGFCPEGSMVQKFWRLCKQRLCISDETEDEDANEEYIEEVNRDIVMIAAAKLVASETVPKDYLGPEIISHFVMHGMAVTEIVKHLIAVLQKTANDSIPDLFLGALKRTYQGHAEKLAKSDDEYITSKSLEDCKNLANHLSGIFMGAARSKHRPNLLKIVEEGISFAFMNAPKQLSFLEGAVLQFVPRLLPSDAVDVLKDVQKRTENVNTDEDPSGWHPYYAFVDQLREKYAKNEGLQEEKEGSKPKRSRGRPRKRKNLRGRKLFGEQDTSEEDSISESEQDQDEEMNEAEEEEELPLIHSIRSSSSKLRPLRVSQQESQGQAGTAGSVKSPSEKHNSRTTGIAR